MSKVHKAEYASFNNNTLTVCVLTYMDGTTSVGESTGGEEAARSLAEHRYSLRTRYLGKPNHE